jgi:hypothetical protein
MTKPMIRIHDLETNKIVDREMTTAEFNEYKKRQEIVAAEQAEAEAKAQAKTELLQRLGISEEEAKLLLS